MAILPDVSAHRAKFRRPTEVPHPADNAVSPARTELGRKLFHDPRLSGSNLLSCASCHNPSFGWEDGQPLGRGDGMGLLKRHTPTVLNLAWGASFFWDGRAETLEEQALLPIQATDEMAITMVDLVAKLRGIDGYRPLFEAAYPGDGISAASIGKALAQYQRTLVSGTTPFDRWVDGDESAISSDAKAGFALFVGKGRCALCHTGWNFTDDGFHDIGLTTDDPGRGGLLPDVPELKHAFKTPGLRQIAERAPYMHNGSLTTLEAVVMHYDGGFTHRASLSPEIVQLGLTADERAQLVAFMRTLSAPQPETAYPALPH